MDFQDILFDVEDGVALLTLNRPDKLNAMTWNTFAEIEHALRFAEDDDAVKVLLITGAGRGFSAGTDLTRPADAPEPERPFPGRRGMMRSPFLLPEQVYRFPKPSLAAVNGVCVGAGLSLALSTDIRIAAEEARFSAIFVKRAIPPDTGTSWFLPRLVGRENALKMIYTGRMVPAPEAKEMGLVSEVVPLAGLMPRARELAGEIARGPSVAIEIARALVTQGLDRPLEDQVLLEQFTQTITAKTEDIEEGRRSFLERREPRFQGR